METYYQLLINKKGSSINKHSSIIKNISLLIIFTFYSIIFFNCYASKTPTDSASIENTSIEPSDMKSGFYLVIGVFSNYENALNHSKEFKNKGYKCDFVYSDSKNKYYTYLYQTDSFNLIKEKYDNLKKESSFKDAWILKVENRNGKEQLEDQIIKEISKHENNESATHHNTHQNILNHNRDFSKTHNSYEVYINTHNEYNETVPATIKVVNGEKATLIGNIQSNKDEILMCPKDYSQNIQLICEIFGYHKTTFDINLTDPITDHTMNNVRIEGKKIIIDLPLLSCEKGDIMVMYNVFFYPNTNIIRQRSNFELQKLLEMLNANPKLKITIHGHTNGNSSGPITKIAGSYDNVFNPSETEGIKGSSKKLSELRAETIKMYLVNNGISTDRLDIKGWGGKKMLHHEDSPLSEYNVRVEIEVNEN